MALEMVASESATRELVEKVCSSETIPSVPVVAANVMALCKDPDVDFGRLGSMISADAALVAKLLRMSNSPVFRAQKRVTTIREALVRLGLKVTRMTVLGFTLESEIARKVPDSFDIDRFWRHSLTTATTARALAETLAPAMRDDAFCAGILLDIGMVVFQCALADEYDKVFAERRLHPTEELFQIEQRVLGATHMDVGAAILCQWGIPAEVYEPVRYHHRPADARAKGLPGPTVQLSKILCLSASVSKLFHDKAKGLSHHEVMDGAAEEFGLSQQVMDRVLHRVDEGVHEMCELFKVDPRNLPSYTEIRIQAAQEVAKLAVEIGQGAQEAERKAEAHMQSLHELQSHTGELEKLAAHDDLTGLLNRREFMRRFGEEIARSKRYGHCLGLLIIDVDHFKKVNDTYGHPVGDIVLKSLSAYLRREMRQSDVVGRLGGEEFVVLLPEPSLEGIITVSEKLRLGVEEVSPAWAPPLAGITVSVGAAFARPESSEFAEMAILKKADICLYQAKGDGRNCTRHFTLT